MFFSSLLANLAMLPLAQILHNHNMAREIKGYPSSAPPFADDPRKYVENPFGFDMTASMVRDQRMSGISAALWGNTSGQV